MAYDQLGIGGLTKELQLATWEKRLLSRFRAETVYNRFGMQKGIPRQGGKTISFRRMEAIYSAGTAGSAAAGSAPAALTEGTPPAAINATWTEVLATVSQYGQVMIITDMLQLQALDDVTTESVENFSEAMTDALDLVTRDVIVAGTNVQYASTGGSRAGEGSGMYLTLAELRSAKRTLLKNNARPVRAEGNKFVVITSPDALYDLEGDTNITNIWQYAGDRGVDTNQLFDVEFRDLPMGFRLYVTTNVRKFVDAGLSLADVYATMVLGEEAYGTVKLDAMPARVIQKQPGTSGIYDPLDQAASIGWKAAHAAVRLNEANMVRIEHVASSNNMG